MAGGKIAGGKVPDWLATFSNRVLPPIFFISMTLLFFYTSNHFEGLLNMELSLAGVFSGMMALLTSLT